MFWAFPSGPGYSLIRLQALPHRPVSAAIPNAGFCWCWWCVLLVRFELRFVLMNLLGLLNCRRGCYFVIATK